MSSSLFRVPNTLLLTGLFSVVAGLAADWLQIPSGTLGIVLVTSGAALMGVGLLTGFFISIGRMFARPRAIVVRVEVVTKEPSASGS